MREFSFGLGVDIFKDTASLPGVQYLMRGTLQSFKAQSCMRWGKRRTRCSKGQSWAGKFWFLPARMRRGQTARRSHKYENSRTSQWVIGYDANALCRSTLLQEMPYLERTGIQNYKLFLDARWEKDIALRSALGIVSDHGLEITVVHDTIVYR